MNKRKKWDQDRDMTWFLSFSCAWSFRGAPSQWCIARKSLRRPWQIFVKDSWIAKCYGHPFSTKCGHHWNARSEKWVTLCSHTIFFQIYYFTNTSFHFKFNVLLQGIYRVNDAQFDMAAIRRIPVDPEKININFTLFEYVPDKRKNRDLIKRQLTCLDVRLTITLSKSSNATMLMARRNGARPKN